MFTEYRGFNEVIKNTFGKKICKKLPDYLIIRLFI